MKCYRWLSIIIPLLVSCQGQNQELVDDHIREIDEINVSVEPIYDDVLTKAVPVYPGYSIKFFNTDTLGIFSIKDGKQATYQMTFPVDTQDENGVTSFSFTGGGWFMSEDYMYQAYSPYNYNNKKASEIPLSFIGQKQIGKDNLNLLGKYMFVTSEASAPVDHKLNITVVFRPTIARLALTLPVATTYKKVFLCADGDDFILESTYNMESSSFGTPKKCGKCVSLSLENVTTSQPNESVMMFMVVCPVDLTGKNLKVVIVDSSDNVYVANYTGAKVFNPGKAKGIVIDGSTMSFVKDNSFILPDDGTADGISGTAPDFIPVGGSTSQPD